MRSIEETQSRWQATRANCSTLIDLQGAIRNNGPSSPCLSGCRSVCWKTFLVFNDTSEDTWKQVLHDARQRYSERRDHFLKFILHPEALTELTVDPLADDPESPWNTVRQDEIIRSEIQQDVQRLPDEANYHDSRIQRMILDVLFMYCKMHPGRGGYRQGMHELVAPIVHVIEQDAVDRANLTESESLDETMLDVLDAAYIEHDTYAVFAKLMERAQAFYEVKDAPTLGVPAAMRLTQEPSSAIVERSKHIHEVCLNKIDPDLAVHLTNIEILPQIFLIRWVRLLYSREFPFNQFLVLWDTMFAMDPSLDLIDLICCAMLIRIRWQLLEADYSVCLQLLLKYPPPDPSHGPQTFIDDALYLRDNANASGGSSLITKYTGKSPAPPGSLAATSATTTSRLDSLRQRASLRSGSPLSSPSRFIQQQQGGMETLIQGAAKGARGMLERGEKLGINQAVREAMGELRKNMQSFNEVRSNDGSKFAADEVAATALAAMERRNKQLASFLDQTVTDLKTLSASNLEDKSKSLELIEVAAAKVQFVQVHLVDASMNLPETSGSSADDSATSQRNNEEPKQKLEESKPTTQTSAPKQTSAPEQTSGPKAAKQPEVLPDDIPVSSLKVSDSKPPAKQQESSALPPKAAPTAEPGADVVRTSADKAPAQTQSQPEAQVPAENTEDPTQSAQPAPSAETKKPQSAPPPKPAIPRATIAQSSFSWMLEPDESTPSKARASPQSPADKSPSMGPNQHRKKGSNNVKRERNAFLFGEVEGDGESDSLKSDQIFGLESMHKDKGVFDS